MTNQVHFEVFGNLGVITLNRPHALNALTTEMCAAMIRVMQAWEKDMRIGAVLVKGAGERAFCAGGDIIMLYESGKARDGRAEAFWRTEYALNEYIYRYKKPYISLIDGIVMGGGVGLSVHGRLRIAGDHTVFAMPETGIGYFPDVGGTFFLPRIKSRSKASETDTQLSRAIGNWLGLTGARLNTGACTALGIANTYVPSKHHKALEKALGQATLDGSDSAVLSVMLDFVQKPPQAEPLPEALSCFRKKSVLAIAAALRKDDSEWARQQLSYLTAKSPLAVAITFEALQKGAGKNFRDCMRQELDLSLNFLQIPDFYEGVRAAVIDKDRQPQWTHKSLASVKAYEIRKAFAPVHPGLKFLEE